MVERATAATVTDFETVGFEVRLRDEEFGGAVATPSTYDLGRRGPDALLRTRCIDAATTSRGRGAELTPAPVSGFEALVSGRYALADHFEHDGVRLLVAVRVDEDAHDEGGLTIRETQVAAYVACGFPLKVAAYELGISIAAAGRASMAAVEKLGVGGRTELAACLQPFLGMPR